MLLQSGMNKTSILVLMYVTFFFQKHTRNVEKKRMRVPIIMLIWISRQYRTIKQHFPNLAHHVATKMEQQTRHHVGLERDNEIKHRLTDSRAHKD